MLKYFILGVLMEFPSSGYDLKNRFLKKLIRDFGFNDGQLYPLLKTMEKQGIITIKDAVSRGRKKYIYKITDRGRIEFIKWLNSSEESAGVIRYDFFRNDEFLSRCNFIKFLSLREAKNKIASHQKLIEEKIYDYKNALKDMKSRHVDPFRIEILRFGLMYLHIKRKWLENLRRNLNILKRKAKIYEKERKDDYEN